MNKTRCAREWELVKKETKNKCCLTFYWIQNCFLIRAVCTTVHACLFSSRFCQPDAVTAVVFRQHAGKSRSRCLQNTHLEARTLHWDIGTAAAAVASALCELPHFSYSQFRVLNITIFRVLFGVEHQRQRQRPKKIENCVIFVRTMNSIFKHTYVVHGSSVGDGALCRCPDIHVLG